jgi:hypothetical protein
VAGREDEVSEAGRAADDREAVGGARPKPAPDLENPSAAKGRHGPLGGSHDRGHPPLVDPQVEAGELQSPRQPHAPVEGRHDHARLVQPDGQRRISGGRLEVDVVALPALDGDREAEPARERRCPGARGQDNLAGRQGPGRGLDGVDPVIPAPEAEGLDTRSDLGAGLGGGSPHLLDEAKRVAVSVPGIEHGSDDSRVERRSRGASLIGGEEP